jgi:FKBP-type peptidyl-prolyl cis-trans isomerase FkpA
MAEVTRVPLQPIAKGSLTKLWVAIVAVIVLAAAIAWASMPAGVTVETISEGEGAAPTAESVVFARYTGMLEDGTVFDQSPEQPLPPEIADLIPDGTPLPLDQMIPGFRDALLQMREGGTYIAEIPAEMAYGAEGNLNPMTGEGVPPNADLTFRIEVVEVLSQAEFQQLSQTLQAIMMQAQQQQMQDGGTGSLPPIQ